MTTSDSKKRLVILDTHAILRRAYHAMPDFTSSKGEPTGGLYGLMTMLVKLITDLKPDYIVAAYDLPKPTYRHAAFKDYKSNRPKAEEALVSQIIRSRDVVRAFGIPIYDLEGFEADDIIGTITEKLKGKKDLEIIIASGDMDTMQLVDGDRVQVYTLKKGITDTILYDEKAVIERYGFVPKLVPDYKGLRGDPSDNIPGVAGVGEKTATILISKFGTIDDIYKALKKHPEELEKAGIKSGMMEKLREQEEEANFSKMLAEIRLDVPIDFTLPTETWKTDEHRKEVLDLAAEFEFRSIAPRINTLFGFKQEGLFGEDGVGLPPLPSGGEGWRGSSANAPTEDEIETAALAVWVLDSSVTQPDLEDIYRAAGTRDFEAAKRALLQKVGENGLSYVYEKVELPLRPVLRNMEKKGMLVDAEALAELSRDYHKKLDAIAKKIYDHAGSEFNINSPKQLGDVIFDTLGLAPARQKKTPGGARSTRESELEKMHDLHPIIDEILSYRELQKLLSTYIDVIPGLLDDEGRLHTTFLQAGTTTGRLASQEPNLQNIPNKGDLGRAIRDAFVAPRGSKLVAFDYSQIELRLAAILSGDEELRAVVREGGDAHAAVAAKMFGVAPEHVTHDQRRRAKAVNFGILYGMGVNALKESLGSTRAEAQEFYNQYFAAFPRLAQYLEETKADATRTGYTTTMFGRRRYFEGIRSPIPYVRAAAERMAVNAPLQGTQADIVKLAMIEIDTLLEREGLRDQAAMLLQIHDELLFEIRDDAIQALAPQIKEIMERIVPEEKRYNVPIIANGKSGKHWGEMKELE